MSSYYDIDAILAEEELLPCSTMFDFAHLAHLDPDQTLETHKYLPEKSRIKMPIWAVQKWAELGFVRISMPRNYTKKSRERLQAEPHDVDLRKKNTHYFRSGLMIVKLVENSYRNIGKGLREQGQKGRQQLAALEELKADVATLQHNLYQAYTGTRLQQTLDWALSSVGEDVTSYTARLTEMEIRLFRTGALAASQQYTWKIYGDRRVIPRASPLKGRVTPEVDELALQRQAKRQKV